MLYPKVKMELKQLAKI